ncbi:MAG: hypothetical protein LBF88_00530 [Planctomycetaceae bacterium]|jgi:type II secretory pathway component GspD/PulD (secretin)|nr:hypothetical protein [Planctomycetaceae bacterium]
MKMLCFFHAQKFVRILLFTLILFQTCCFGCRKKTAEIPSTQPQNGTAVESLKPESPKPEPLKSELLKSEPSQPEPSKPEPSMPEPLKPEFSKSEPSKPESPQPEPSTLELPKPIEIPKPQPVKAETRIDTLKEQEKEKENAGKKNFSVNKDHSVNTVNTESPVNTKSPVNTTSPINTESPVKQPEPLKKPQAAGMLLLHRIFGLGFTVILTEIFAEEEKNETFSPNSSPEPVVTPQSATPQSATPQSATPQSATPEPASPESVVPKPQEELPQSQQLSAEKEPEENKADKKLRFNFKYAPWKDVIEWFADQAGLSLQADSIPQGSLNLTDTQYYTPVEALDVLNSYLLFKEYTIIRKGNTMFVVYLPDGIPPNLLEPITPNELDERGKYEICRCVFSLNRTTPDIIQAEAEKLLGPQGSLVALPKSQQIVITETAGTLRTIRDIIRQIDDPDALSSSVIHTIEMQNLSADEALGIMRKLLAIEESDTSLRTAVDISGTKIWMSGRGDMIERAKEIIKTIDGSFASKNILLEGQPQFDVYDTGIADPVGVLAVLQTLLAGTPDVRLSLDAKTGGIIARGRPANHATIRETIKQMQLNVPQIDVIPLTRLSPLSAVESIKKFFATSTVGETASASTAKTTPTIPAPTVEADVSARQIIVRGTASQIKEIRALLQKLGENGIGGNIANTSTIRNIPLSPAATALVLDQIKEIWPKLEQNEIKIVTPSAIVPMRSTNDLKPKEERDKKNEKSVDELIDETFEKESPTTQFRTNFFYRPVQQTKITETESPYQPIYQPIQALETSETAELKRRIDELQKQLETLQEVSKTSKTDSVSVTDSKSSSAPVVISSGPNGLMISSEDPEALNRLEELIRMLSDESVLGKTRLKVYYLKNSTAEVVAQTLQTLMNSGNTSTFGVSGAGSLDTSTKFEGEQRVEILGLLARGDSIEKTGPVSISAESRLNALFVQANPVDHKTIERLLPILDQADIQGGDILNRPKPRLIPLQNMRVENALMVVEKVYANRIQGGTGNPATPATSGGNRNSNQRTPGGYQIQTPTPMAGVTSPMGIPPMPQGMVPGMQGGPGAMAQQLMRMGGQGGSATPKEPEPTMTLSVHSPSNSLIVSAPESLFLQVEAFVKELDEIAVQTETIITVLPLKISPDLARQTIGNVYGDSVKFSTSRSSVSSSSSNSFGGFGSNNRFGSNATGFGGFNRIGNTGFGNTGFGGGNNPFLNIMRGGGFGANSGGFGGVRPGGLGR